MNFLAPTTCYEQVLTCNITQIDKDPLLSGADKLTRRVPSVIDMGRRALLQ
jgi:hypothetical protein